MIITKKRGFKKMCAYDGGGIFDSITIFLGSLFTSNAAKQIASSAFHVGKSVAKEGAKKALEAGFSPFELVFGHSVRGPLKLYKEKLFSEDDSSLNILSYVSNFRHKLSETCELAQNNLGSVQSKMKERYDEFNLDLFNQEIRF